VRENILAVIRACSVLDIGLHLAKVKANTPANVKGVSSRSSEPQASDSSAKHSRREAPLLKGFGAFLTRGNVIDLAVAVVIGGAFTAVVNALVKDFLTPFIAAMVGKPNFSTLGFTIRSTHFPIGDFVNTLIDFVVDAIVIYYVVVLPIRVLSERFRKPVPTPAEKNCPECLSAIPLDARRCKFCTALQGATA
jgi:large conductance mechanosensitive channel